MKRKQFFALLLSAAVTLQPAAPMSFAEEAHTEETMPQEAAEEGGEAGAAAQEDGEAEAAAQEDSKAETAAGESSGAEAAAQEGDGAEATAENGEAEAAAQEENEAGTASEEDGVPERAAQEENEAEAASGEGGEADSAAGAENEKPAEENTSSGEEHSGAEEEPAEASPAQETEPSAETQNAPEESANSQSGQETAAQDEGGTSEENGQPEGNSEGSAPDETESTKRDAEDSAAKSGKKAKAQESPSIIPESVLSAEELEAAAAENFLKIEECTVALKNGLAEITLFTGQRDYDAISFDDPAQGDAEIIAKSEEEAQQSGKEENAQADGFRFCFTVPQEKLGTIVRYYVRRSGGEWYREKALYMRIPAESTQKEDAAETESADAAAKMAEDAAGKDSEATKREALFLSEEMQTEEMQTEKMQTEAVVGGDAQNSGEIGETIVPQEDSVLFLSADAGAEAAFDNSTDLQDGTYAIPPSDFTWEGGTGKARLTCEQVIISGGKATARFTASSSNMTHAYCGYAPSNDETATLYNPDTGAMGTNVYAISGKSVTLPVRLNESVDLACRTIAMSDPHWVRYTYTITLDAPKAETESNQDETQDQSETQNQSETQSQSETQKQSETKNPSETQDQSETQSQSETQKQSGDADQKQTEKNAQTEKASAASKDETAAGKVEDTLKALPAAKSVTLSDKKAISAARKAYDKLTAKQKKLVSAAALKRLTNAEAALKKLQENPVPVENGKITSDGVYNVANVELAEGYKMFNVIACELTVKDGKMTAVITLHGTGLDYMYAGKAKKAEKADKSDWIPYKLDDEGHFTFEIPVKKLDTVIVYSARSKRYAEMAEAGEEVTAPIWYDKGLIFHSDSITKVGEDSGTEKSKSTEKDKSNEQSSGQNKDTSKNSGTNGSGKSSSSTGGGSTGSGGSSGSGSGSGSSGYAANTDGSTGAVDSSTALADGTYSPDSFSWSGGTGKLSISCSQITISGGKAYATLVFSSGKIVYVKADGSQLGPVSQTDSTSTYEVPVALNANNTILACTTAMSQPHEVEYTVYVGLEAAKKAAATKGSTGTGSGSSAKGSGASASGGSAGSAGGNGKAGESAEGEETFIDENGLTLRAEETYPSIPGATYVGTLVTEYAKKYRLHFYEDGIRLIEITLSDDEESVWDAKNASDAGGTADAQAETAAPGNGDASEYDAKSGDLTQAGDEEGTASEEKSLYENGILQYLLVPETVSLPAGIEKDMLVLKLPVEKVYVDSDTAAKIAAKLGQTVTEGRIGKSAYKELVKTGAELVIASPKQLVESAGVENDGEDSRSTQSAGGNQEAEEVAAAAVRQYGDMLALLEIPLLVDRADEEKEELGRYEWLLLYGTLFDCPKEALDAYQAAREALKGEDGSAKERGAQEKPQNEAASDPENEEVENP